MTDNKTWQHFNIWQNQIIDVNLSINVNVFKIKDSIFLINGVAKFRFERETRCIFSPLYCIRIQPRNRENGVTTDWLYKGGNESFFSRASTIAGC
jgi:hypothetical protein